MARLPPLLVFILLYIDFGECVQVILGDPVTFPATGNCTPDEPAKLHRVGQHGTRLVAAREQGVWKPTEEHKDRVNRNSSLAFSRTVYTDTGLYQLVCGSFEKDIQLDVIVGFKASVTEGEPVTLQCYCITTGKHVDSVRWDKNGETVLEHNLLSGETKYGAGFKGRVFLSPDGDKQGDWSLVLDAAQLEDEGDYFCSVHNEGVREGWGDPAAVRVKVFERKLDQTTIRPPLTPTQSATEEKTGTWAIVATTAAVVFIIVAPLFFVLGWWLKSCCSKVPPGPSGGEQYSRVATGQSNGGPPQADGLNSSHGESGV